MPRSQYRKRRPSLKSRELCTKRGWAVGSTESHNTFTHKTNDLFGFIDLVAMNNHNIIAIQTTSRANVSARVRKITDECQLAAVRWLRSGGRILIHGWGSKGDRKGAPLICREIEIVLVSNGLMAVEKGNANEST